MDKLLFTSGLISMTTELFPDFGYSYFYPSNKSIDFYDQMECQRWIIVFLVWFPIACSLYKLSQLYSILAIICIMSAFYLHRNSRYIKNYHNTSLLYVIGFSIIAWILNQNEDNNSAKIINILSILFIFGGGSLMGKFRKKNIRKDMWGRLLFSLGFVGFIDSLYRKNP